MLRWILLALAFGIGPGGCWTRGPSPAPDLLRTGSDLSQGTEHWQTWKFCSFGFLTRTASVDLLEVTLQPDKRPGEVLLRRREYLTRPYFLLPMDIAEGTASGLHHSEQVFQTDLRAVDYASRGTHEWYVAGRRLLDGSKGWEVGDRLLVERWEILPAEGEPFGERPVAKGAGPVAHRSAELQVLGGTYRAPGAREESTLRRTFLGELPPQVTALRADPDGRFLLLLAPKAGRLYRAALDGDQLGDPQLLIEHPLIQNATHLRVGRHALDRIRRYVVHAAGTSIHFVDRRLDGQLEGPVIFSPKDSAQLGLDDPRQWIERYDRAQPAYGIRDRLGRWLD